MNRGELRDATYDRLGTTASDAKYPADVVDRLVNEALHLIEVEWPWPWLRTRTTFTTTADDGVYAVPDDWLNTRGLRIDTYLGMTRLSIDELEDNWPDESVTGRPRAFAVDGDELHLRPIPDDTYTVIHRYTMRESDLYSDGDTPLMPASFHTAIAELAAYTGLRRGREEARAQVCLQAYQGWQTRMLDDRRRTTSPARIRRKLSRS